MTTDRAQSVLDGVRVNLIGKIKKVKIKFHIDLGVGDVIVPEKPQEIPLPTQLPDFKAPVVLAYPLTSVIANPGLVGYWDRFAGDTLYMNNFDFGEIIDGIHKFVEPALNAVICEEEFFKHWDPVSMNWFSNDPTV